MLAALPILLLMNPSFGQGPPTALDPSYGRAIPKRGTGPKAVPDAAWIWSKRVAADQTIFARGQFRLEEKPNRATLFVTADNAFTVYVNGREVGKTASDPNDGNLWRKVQAIDVAPWLTSGSNVVGVRAHNVGDAAGLVARLEVDGRLVLKSDRGWKVSEEIPTGGWTEAAFNDAGWVVATEGGRAGEGPWGDRLEGWPVALNSIPDYLAHMTIAPVRWAYASGSAAIDWRPARIGMRIERPQGSGPTENWRVLLDFGKELTGRVSAEGSTPGLTLGTGESVGEALDKPWTTTTGSTTPNTALRYVSVSVPSHERRIDLKARMEHIYYPVRYRGRFDCSDPLLTRVWYTGAYTAHLCMQDDIWDGPKRDRWRWMGDLHVSGEVINNVFADLFLMERTMTRLREDVQGGRPARELPNAHVNGITGYSYSWVVGLADYYRHLGRREYLQSQHDSLVSMLEYCAQEIDDEGGYSNRHNAWMFVDWATDLTKETPEARATTQLFLYKALGEGAYLLGELGDKANAAKYGALAERVKKASQGHLATPNGTFGRRKQRNAMAIYSGVATAAQAAKILDSGLLRLTPEVSDLEASPYYANYLLHAMGMADRAQDGIDYVRGFYGKMVEDGATSFYEHYNPAWKKRDHAHLQWGENENAAAGYHVSLCHGWSAGPTTYLTEYVLGVSPTGAGFKTFSISPRLGDLAWASGIVPTPGGDISVRAERKADRFILKIEVPKGTTALVTLPVSISNVDGKPRPGSSVSLGAGTHSVSGP
ncbi:hypothetical protein EON81_00240 [bacterium]|nr:MAG: hypothetical protein EON81_00240 [bacterium]